MYSDKYEIDIKSTIEDLEKLQEAHESIKNKDMLLKGIMDVAPSGIVVLNAIRDESNQVVDMKCTIINKRAKEILKLEDVEVVGRNVLDVLPSLQVHNIWRQFVDVVDKSVNIEIEHRFDGDGIEGWFHTTAIRYGDGLVCMFYEITKEKMYEEELAFQLERLKLALGVAVIGSWEYYPDTKTMIWDDAQYQIFGLEKSGSGNDYDLWKKMVHPDDIVWIERELEHAINQNRLFEARFRILWKNGTIRHLFCVGKLINNAKEPKMVGLNRDITEEVKLQKEHELYEDARFKQTQELLRNIAHHWRQPLNVVSMGFDALIDMTKSGADEEMINLHVARIHTELQQLSKTITFFAREFEGYGRSGECSLGLILQNSLEWVEPLLEWHNIECRIDVSEKFFVRAKCVQMLDLFTNLFLNVIDAVQRKKLEEALVYIYAKRVGDEIVLTFEDNCGGIDETLLPDRLFEPYTTTQFKSRDKGLGLYIVRYTVTNVLHGVITAQNTPSGARFTIRVPT